MVKKVTSDIERTWKVVKLDDKSSYRSVHIDRGLYSVQYKINEWVVPHRGPLNRGYGLVGFNDPDMAVRYMLQMIREHEQDPQPPKFYTFVALGWKPMPLPAYCDPHWVRQGVLFPLDHPQPWEAGAVHYHAIQIMELYR